MNQNEPYIPPFEEYTDRLLPMLRDKNLKYGTGNLDRAAVLARVRDKLARLQNMKEGDPDAEDAWLDLGGYAAIGWLMREGLWPQMAMPPLLYIAHPIDRVSDYKRGVYNSRARVIAEDATKLGWQVYIPSQWLAKDGSGYVGRVNQMLLTEAKLVIVLWEKGDVSHGTGAEVITAHKLGIPIWRLGAGSEVLTELAQREFTGVTAVAEALKGRDLIE